jgi:hypothetical protein
MMTRADGWRRWWGTFCLIMAVGMLLWGQTLLAAYLEGLGYVIYWLVCFGFVFLAILIAGLDLWIVRRRVQRERTELIRKTWNEIQRERADRGDSSQPPQSSN